MPYELIKDRMVFRENVAKDTMQLLLEGDIIVPDIRPDMAVVLKTDADIYTEKTELSTDRISFTGRMDIKVLYLCKGDTKTVHSMSTVHKIDDFMNLEGVNKDMWAELDADIINIDFKMLNDRKLSYKAVVEITVDVEGKCEKDIVKTIPGIPENQLKKNALDVNRTVDNAEERFIIKEELNLPTGKPNIKEVLQSGVHITNKDLRVGNGRASINGDVSVYVIYKGEDDSALIEFFEAEVPFNGAIELPAAREDQIGDLSLNTEGHFITVKENSDGEDRTFDVEIPVRARIRTSRQSEAEVLSDAFIVNKNVGLVKENLTYPQLICKNKNQCSVKEIVEIDDKCPDILQVFRVNGNVHVDSTKVIDDKVIVEGVIDTNVLYIAKDDDTPVYNYSSVLPFKQVVETKGAAPDMQVKIDKNIDHVGFNMLSDREVELRFLISFNTAVSCQKTADLVTDVNIEDIPAEILDAMPSIIIYVVQKGDTLWNIARKYNVSLDELAEINEIENKNLIFPGQKLLILKRV